MATRSTRWEHLFALGLCLLAGVGGDGAAQDYTEWQHDPATPGDWFTPANWTLGVPGTTDYAVIDNGGTAQIASGAAECEYLYAGDAAHGEVEQTGGSLTVGQQLIVGLAQGGCGSGRYELRGGTLTTWQTALGGWSPSHGTFGQGTFVQSGGTHTVAYGLLLGTGHPLASGSYTMSDGLLDVALGQIWVGFVESTGSFVLNAGTVQVWLFAIDKGTIHLNGGTTVAQRFSVDLGGAVSAPGAGAVLRVNELDGYSLYPFEMSGALQIGHPGGLGTGSVTIGAGDELTVGRDLVVAHSAPARVTVAGGTVNVGETFRVKPSGAVQFDAGLIVAETVELMPGGQLNTSAGTVLRTNGVALSGGAGAPALPGLHLQIGHTGGTGSGAQTFGAGESWVCGELTAGYNAPADVAIRDGGQVACDNGYVASQPGSRGTVTIGGAGSSWGLSECLYVGGTDPSAGGDAVVSIEAGGTLTVADTLVIWTSGTVNLDGGTLVAGDIEKRGSAFNWTAGTLQLTRAAMQIDDGAGGFLGGSATVDEQMSLSVSSDLIVGATGTGSVTQTGGSSVVEGRLILAAEPGSLGQYASSGGTLRAGRIDVGPAGQGTLRIEDAAAQVIVTGTLCFGPAAALVAAPEATIHMTGADWVNECTDPARLAGLGNLKLVFEGGGGQTDLLEVAGRDLGAAAAGWQDNFALHALELGGAAAGRVRLVDDFDNQPLWEPAEALYVDSLVLNAGASVTLGDGGDLCLYYLNGGPPKKLFLGDTTLDGQVDYLDLGFVATNYGQTGMAWANGDFTGDGQVTYLDLGMLASRYGSQSGQSPAGSSAGAPAPEPGVAVLLLAAAAGAIRRRRRTHGKPPGVSSCRAPRPGRSIQP